MVNVLNYNKFLLCESDKNSEYIQNTSTAINKNSVIELIKSNCTSYDFTNPKMIIYRGLTSSEPFLFISPSKFERKSVGIAVKNYYTDIIDNSVIWKDYPKRSRSCIGIQSERYASVYGQIYIMIPFDKALFGVCPKPDLIFSFKYLKDRKFDSIDFNDLLKNFYEDLFKENLDDSSWNNLKLCLQKFDNKFEQENINKRLNKINIFFMRELWSNFIYKNTKNLLFIDYITDTVFNPIQNGFKILKWDSTSKIPPNKEIWTDSDIILIKKEYFETVKNSL